MPEPIYKDKTPSILAKKHFFQHIGIAVSCCLPVIPAIELAGKDFPLYANDADHFIQGIRKTGKYSNIANFIGARKLAVEEFGPVIEEIPFSRLFDAGLYSIEIEAEMGSLVTATELYGDLVRLAMKTIAARTLGQKNSPELRSKAVRFTNRENSNLSPLLTPTLIDYENSHLCAKVKEGYVFQPLRDFVQDVVVPDRIFIHEFGKYGLTPKE